jgi:hypothetical protein
MPKADSCTAAISSLIRLCTQRGKQPTVPAAKCREGSRQQRRRHPNGILQREKRWFVVRTFRTRAAGRSPLIQSEMIARWPSPNRIFRKRLVSYFLKGQLVIIRVDKDVKPPVCQSTALNVFHLQASLGAFSRHLQSQQSQSRVRA